LLLFQDQHFFAAFSHVFYQDNSIVTAKDESLYQFSYQFSSFVSMSDINLLVYESQMDADSFCHNVDTCFREDIRMSDPFRIDHPVLDLLEY